MHRKVKGLLSLILTLAMVTVSVAPASAEELSVEPQPSEEQMIAEMIETEPETVVPNVAEANPTPAPVEEQLITETAEAEPEQRNLEEAEPVSTSSTDLDYLYDNLTEDQRQFRVYAGTDISSELIFMDNGITPDSANLDAQGGDIVKVLLESRQGDLKFYRLSRWNVWKVDSNGAPEGIQTASNSSLLSRSATTNNFKQSAYLQNNGTGTAPKVICQKPILEPVWACNDFTIPVYDINGNDTGMSITINAENYNDGSQVAFPNVESDSWKLIYNSIESPLNTASEIWTNEINGIRTIGTDFDVSQARVQAVASQTVLQPGNAEFVQPDWYEGQPMTAPVVSSETNGVENITYYYKEAEADDSSYTTTVPDKAGAYTAKAVFAATEIYEEVVKTADFHILPAPVILQEGTAEFAQPDWYEGQPKPAPVVSSETNGIENITYYYKEAGADDSTYTTTAPDKAGAYTAKAVFAATEIYEEVVKTADFHILPVQVVLGEGTAEFMQPDWYEGQPKPAPIVRSETNGVENITYYYKEAGADDSTYTNIEPGKAGAYTAMAVFAATEEYQEVIKTADFQILPIQTVLQEGTAEFVQPGWYEGQPKPDPVVRSETNGTENITYYYKEAGADDSAYTAVVPDKAGKYTAKAVFAATELYQEVTKTSDFEILPNISVDEIAPVISGVSNGQTYYGDQAVTVTDENLHTVTVNGESVEISNNRAEFTLKPSEDVYKIIAVDMVGNRTEYTIEVWETWVRDGIITNGKKKLRRERIYKLGSGKWTIDGDSTVYSGGGTFYVKNSGEYDFKRK